jgi:hypothetical protein
MKKFILSLSVVVFAFGSILAQVRPVTNDDARPRVVNAPASFYARYEGGMFGYSEKEKGSLKFDDASGRLVFYGKDGKEKFSLPYDSMLVVYPNSESVTSTTGNVVKWIPLPGAGLASLLKEKRRYLVIQFDDPNVDAKGTVSFRLEDKETLQTVIPAIGAKAKMESRGDAYYRPRTRSNT